MNVMTITSAMPMDGRTMAGGMDGEGMSANIDMNGASMIGITVLMRLHTGRGPMLPFPLFHCPDSAYGFPV